MKKKFSNRKKEPQQVKADKAKAKAKAKSKAKQKQAANVSKKKEPAPIKRDLPKKEKNVLYLISSDSKNIGNNIQSSIDTWLKNIGKGCDYLFLCDKTIEEKNCISCPDINYNNHNSYSSKNMKWFLTRELWRLPIEYEYICFCTDTTYLDTAKIFIDDFLLSHWGCVTNLFYPSMEELKRINPSIDTNEVRMYHAEAGFVISKDIIRKIAYRLDHTNNILSDRWDSMIGYMLYLLKIELNHDELFFSFPHSMLNLSDEDVKKSKSHGYLKDYEKAEIHRILTGR